MGVWALFCIKCGKQIEDDQVFCEGCLQIMERYPVKPGTPVQLPNRSASAAKKPAQRKKPLSAKEQNIRLRKLLRWMTTALVVLLLALTVTVSMLVHTVQERDMKGAIGKNYNTINTEADGK